jgi:hypothetical protein
MNVGIKISKQTMLSRKKELPENIHTTIFGEERKKIGNKNKTKRYKSSNIYGHRKLIISPLTSPLLSPMAYQRRSR